MPVISRYFRVRTEVLLPLILFFPSAWAGPAYDLDRAQLESVLADMQSWLPGEWSPVPQIWYERNVTMPEEGEHEHWYRTFALIDAPQVGDTVFYGQVNLGGPFGPIIARSQVLYKAFVDIDAGVVRIHGQPIANPDEFTDLHRRPELWRKARMPDESALNCSFIWRRHGRQVVGVLEANKPEGNKYGPGTCSYISGNGQEFVADAEWVLSPDELWLYDNNTMGGVLFNGRNDRTHQRLYRVTYYKCALSDASGTRTVVAHDRGFRTAVESDSGQELTAMLLRAWYPAEAGGLIDELRLTLSDSNDNVLVTARVPERASSISVRTNETQVNCLPEA